MKDNFKEQVRSIQTVINTNAAALKRLIRQCESLSQIIQSELQWIEDKISLEDETDLKDIQDKINDLQEAVYKIRDSLKEKE